MYLEDLLQTPEHSNHSVPRHSLCWIFVDPIPAKEFLATTKPRKETSKHLSYLQIVEYLKDGKGPIRNDVFTSLQTSTWPKATSSNAKSCFINRDSHHYLVDMLTGS